MGHIPAAEIPSDMRRAAEPSRQGRLVEERYWARHYINERRQLAAAERILETEAGRPVVKGEPLTKPCHVYLPAGYDPEDASVRYPVLYLLHGVGGDHFEWLNGSRTEDDRPVICNVIDHLIARGEMEPAIVVFPNGRASHAWGDASFNFAGTNMLGFYYFDYELRHDLIPFIEGKYHTRANIRDTSPEGVAYNRRHRAIAGLSMGGMQVLNLVLGGYRHDSAAFAGPPENGDGLVPTVRAPGMLDLFGYAGAFSNAPTSSEGVILGESIRNSGWPLDLLYMTCGDADGISIERYESSIAGLAEQAGDALGAFHQVLIQKGVHDFRVWNHGAMQFMRLAFRPREREKTEIIHLTLEDPGQ